MTQPSFQAPLPSISSTLPSPPQQLDYAFPSWPIAPVPTEPQPQPLYASFERDHTPPLNFQQPQPRVSTPAASYTPPPSYLPVVPTRVPSLDESSPPTWNRLTATYSPNSTSTGSHSPVHTPRGETPLYTTELSSQQPPLEPWQPKPRVWTEQPLFDDLKYRESPPLRMQQSSSYPGPMMPMVGSSLAGPNDYNNMPVPAYGGGGLGAAFPDLLPQPTYDSSLPHSMPIAGDMDPYRMGDRPHVGPAEYAQALDAFHYIQASIPYMRRADPMAPQATGQPFRSVFECASTAVDMLSGRIPAKQPSFAGAHPRPMGMSGPEPKRVRMGHFGEKDKPSTYCRGCGATETPEWRRGPLGPRTLCNACGLVHMKMMRKKKKAEERAAAAAASSKGV